MQRVLLDVAGTPSLSATIAPAAAAARGEGHIGAKGPIMMAAHTNLMRASPHEQALRRPRMMCLYSNFISSGDLVFDVGANHGDRTEIFLALGARVVAVEPQPVCVRILRERFKADPRVDIVEGALGAQNGRALLRLSDNDLVSSMNPRWVERVSSGGRFDDSRWLDEVEVPTLTMDEMIARYGLPRFAKIDVEGYEPQVLKGLHELIPQLSFEYTPEYVELASECVRTLCRLGPYAFNLSPGETMSFPRSSFVSGSEILEHLEDFGDHKEGEESGDIYAILQNRCQKREGEQDW